MRILYVTSHSPWPVGSGSRVRSSHIIEALSRHHEVVVALANDSPTELDKFWSDRGTKWSRLAASRPKRTFLNRIPGVMFGGYRHALRCKNRNMHHKDLLRWVDEVKPDLVWYFQSQSIWHTGQAPGIPSVYDTDDLDSVKRARQLLHGPFPQRLTASLDSLSFRRAERTLMDSADLVTVSNPGDEAAIRAMTRSKVLHLPNGFDFSSQPMIVPRRSNRIIFYGTMIYRPSAEGVLWFCDEIWPLIRNAAPDTEFDVVGRYDEFAEHIGSLPGVTLHGFVEDIDQLISQSACLIVPLRIGSGTRIKILEAWAKGIPVVSTSIGCEGLGAVDKENILVADSPKLFAEQCLRLLAEPELGARLAREAYSCARGRFDWSVVSPIIERAVELARA